MDGNRRKSDSYKLSVESADEYEDLIAEIHFPDHFGLIISQERGEGLFDVSAHSFSADAPDNFDYTRNTRNNKIPLSQLIEAIDRAKSELVRLKRAD
jgi:hypothetical protein